VLGVKVMVERLVGSDLFCIS